MGNTQSQCQHLKFILIFKPFVNTFLESSDSHHIVQSKAKRETKNSMEGVPILKVHVSL